MTWSEPAPAPAHSPVAAGPAFITRAPADVAGWVAALDGIDIPVLASTDDTLAELRCNEDAVDAHLLADTMVSDPLMTLKLLRHVAVLRKGRDQTDPETATEALVMLGITPFFRDFGPQPTVEQRLHGQADALAGLRRVLRRARRAARFALGFAVHRQDHDAALLHEAALLHDFAELLLWAQAPALALALARRQQADPGLRSADAQRALLHTRLAELQQALMKTWRLPPMLVQISRGQAGPPSTSLSPSPSRAPAQAPPQVRNVQLAIRLARHSAEGWDNPALPDDVDEIAALLHLGIEPTLALLHDLDL